MDRVERLIPRDALEAPAPRSTDAAHRIHQALRAVHEFGGVMRDLIADHALGVRQRLRAAHLDDAAVIDRHGEAAGVGTIERADAGKFGAHERLPPNRRQITTAGAAPA